MLSPSKAVVRVGLPDNKAHSCGVYHRMLEISISGHGVKMRRSPVRGPAVGRLSAKAKSTDPTAYFLNRVLRRSRNSPGDRLVQRLNARWKVLSSEKPRESAISSSESRDFKSKWAATSCRN